MTRLRLTEPVRLYLYSVAAATITLLIGIDVVSDSLGALIGGLVVTLLAVPVVEVTRASVYAPDTVDQIVTARHRKVTER